MGDAYGAGLISHISKDLHSLDTDQMLYEVQSKDGKTPRSAEESCITIDTNLW